MAQVPSKSRLENAKTWIEVVQGVATVAAVVVGAWWFIEQRSINENIKLDQTVTWQQADGVHHTLLVAVEVHATNIGKVKVDLQPGLLEVMQANPQTQAPQLLYASPLAAMRLEPGESAQAIFRVVPMYDTVKAIQVHSCYEVPESHLASVACDYAESHPDPTRKNRYWNLLSIAEIGSSAARRQTDSSVH